MHSKKDCKNHEPDVTTKKHSAKIVLAELIVPPVLKMASNAKALALNLKKLRKAVAPELAARLHAEREAERLTAVKAAAKTLATAAAAAAAARQRTAQLDPNGEKAAADRANERSRAERHEIHARVTAELRGLQVSSALARLSRASQRPGSPPQASHPASGQNAAVPAAATPTTLSCGAPLTPDTLPTLTPPLADALSTSASKTEGAGTVEMQDLIWTTDQTPDQNRDGDESNPMIVDFDTDQWPQSDAEARTEAVMHQPELPMDDGAGLQSHQAGSTVGYSTIDVDFDRRISTTRETDPASSTLADPNTSPSKRDKSTTVTEDSAPDTELGEPVNRQARSNTLHKTIRFVAADCSRTQDNRALDKGTDPSVQLTVPQFFTPSRLQNTGNGGSPTSGVAPVALLLTSQDNASTNGSLFTSQKLYMKIAEPCSSTSLHDWLQVLKAEEVDVPANGSCFYFAIHAARARTCRGTSISICKGHNREANYFKREINEALNNNIEEMVRIGSVSLPQVFECYFPGEVPTSPEEDMCRIRAFIISKSKLSSGAVSQRHHWARTEDIMAAVLFIRDPIFVIDVPHDGHAYVQIYYLDYHENGDCSVTERVKIAALQTERASVIILTLLNYYVIPIVLSLHHRAGSERFRALRFNSEFYKAWNGPVGGFDTMLQRRYAAQSELGIPLVANSDEVKEMPSKSAVDTGSDHVLFQTQVSQNSARDHSPARELDPDLIADHSSDHEDCKSTSPSQMELQTPASSLDVKSSADVMTAPSDGISIDSDFDADGTSDIFARRSKTISVSSEKYRGILQAAGTENSDSEELQVVARARAGKANLDAFKCWKHRHSKTRVAALQLDDTTLSLAEACQRMRGQPAYFTELIRDLPFPELVLAAVPGSVLTDIGRELVCRGRTVMIDQLIEISTSTEATLMLHTWKDVLLSGASSQVRWTIAQSDKYWVKAKSLLKTSTFIKEVPDTEAREFCHLVASVLAVRAAIPGSWRALTLDLQCDALLRWMSASASHAHIRSAITELRCQNWASLRSLFLTQLEAASPDPLPSPDDDKDEGSDQQ